MIIYPTCKTGSRNLARVVEHVKMFQCKYNCVRVKVITDGEKKNTVWLPVANKVANRRIMSHNVVIPFCDNHRIIKRLRLEGTLKDHLAQLLSPCNTVSLMHAGGAQCTGANRWKQILSQKVHLA